MEGLLIAEQLRSLAGRLPAARGAWRFPDDRTAVLPLLDGTIIRLDTGPVAPRVEVVLGGADDQRAQGRQARGSRTPLQAQLAARATGNLVAVEQQALDRVFRLSFGEGHGFVPEQPIDLVVELTGRNANLILVAEDGRIVGAQRVVTVEQNRHRQVMVGARYRPPPEYTKLDPRTALAEQLRESLAGKPLTEVRKLIDGVGPQLCAALRNSLRPIDESAPLAGSELDRVLTAIQELVTAPADMVARFSEEQRDPAAPSRDVEARRQSLVRRLTKLARAADRRVADARLALQAAADATELRAQADLLLARSASFAPVGDEVVLPGFDDSPIRLRIDPALDAAGNAALRYDRARRRSARAERAETLLPELEVRAEELGRSLAAVPDADLKRLRELEAWLLEVEGAGTGNPKRSTGASSRHQRTLPGVRFVDPRGFEVLVGRSAKENDAITFGAAKSRDLWLHVQGYQGSHVLVRSQGKEVPFDTVLFAARLAAGFSRARQSDNVAVDYTERKNVWRVKGAAPGAVNIAHQKTVYVTPARSDAAAAGQLST